MTTAVFNLMFDKLIGAEGGYQNDPDDRGNWTSGIIGKGECKGTKYGVSAMAYPDLDIENLTIEQAKKIFYNDYWCKVKADNLPDALSIMVSDTAYNSGCRTAIKLLQKSLGIAIDGKIGNTTIGAANRLPVKKTLADYAVYRLQFLNGCKGWSKYGKGWSRRVCEMEKLAGEYV